MRHLDYPPVLACGADTHTHLLAFGIFCCFCMEQHKTIPSLLFERHLGGEYASYVGPYVSLITECVSWSCAAEVLSECRCLCMRHLGSQYVSFTKHAQHTMEIHRHIANPYNDSVVARDVLALAWACFVRRP